MKPRVGDEVSFGFIERGTCVDHRTGSFEYEVARSAVGTFKGFTSGGMARVWFEGSNVEVTTVPEAVSVLKRKPMHGFRVHMTAYRILDKVPFCGTPFVDPPLVDDGQQDNPKTTQLTHRWANVTCGRCLKKAAKMGRLASNYRTASKSKP